MGQSSDQLRQEIDQHRHDAERKIDDLQGQVQGTTEDLRAQARGTVEDVREQVQGTVEDTVHKVTENVDIEQFIQERPLVSLGAALIGGFVVGGMLGGGDGSRGSSRSHDYSGSSAGGSGGGSAAGAAHSLQHAYKSSGLEDTVNSGIAALMGSLTDQVKHSMDRNMPGFSQRMNTAQHTEGWGARQDAHRPVVAAQHTRDCEGRPLGCPSCLCHSGETRVGAHPAGDGRAQQEPRSSRTGVLAHLSIP